MARHQKNNADYHSHDKDMRNDPKVKALRRKFKHEGYSIYNMILELLDDADGFTLKFNELNTELWAGDFEIEPEKLKEIIEYSIHVGLLILLDDEIFSEGHIKRMTGLLDKRKKKREAFQAAKSGTNGISDEKNTHSKVKESIVKKSKEKKRKVKNNTTTVSPVGGPENLYPYFISVYDEFIKNKTSCPAKMDGVQGNAAKSIISYLRTASNDKTDEGVMKSWSFILGHWDRLEPFKQEKLKLTEINSDLINIINQVRNGNSKGKSKPAVSSSNLDAIIIGAVGAKQQS